MYIYRIGNCQHYDSSNLTLYLISSEQRT